jgi:hypothetical protein
VYVGWIFFFFLSYFLFELIKKANHYNKTFKRFCFLTGRKEKTPSSFPHPFLFPLCLWAFKSEE